MMIQFEDLLQRLRAAASGSFSAGKPASAGAIDEAALCLGVQFPDSYRRFLEVLGELQVPREVFGIARSARDASVVAESVQWRSDGAVPARAVVIEVDDLEGHPVGFVPLLDGAEPPIVRWGDHGATVVANNFADYLTSLVEDILPRGAGASVHTFDPAWGLRRVGSALVTDRKEVKLAYTLVQRVKYDGVSFATLVQELNSRRIPARGLREWTIEAAREAYETWKDRY